MRECIVAEGDSVTLEVPSSSLGDDCSESHYYQSGLCGDVLVCGRRSRWCRSWGHVHTTCIRTHIIGSPSRGTLVSETPCSFPMHACRHVCTATACTGMWAYMSSCLADV